METKGKGQVFEGLAVLFPSITTLWSELSDLFEVVYVTRRDKWMRKE